MAIEYQKLEDIEFIQGDNPEFRVSPTTPEYQITELIRQSIIQKHWWLDPYFQKKLPTEQIVGAVRGHTVSLFNFGRRLTEAEQQEYSYFLALVSQFNPSDEFPKHKFILIDDQEDVVKLKTGELVNGENLTHDRGFLRLFPPVFASLQHRVGNVSNFLGTLVHEIGHSYEGNIHFEWMDQFGWDRSTGQTNHLEWCITPYATKFPEEDICDSITGLIFNPQNLYPAKNSMLDATILKGLNTDQVGPSLTVLAGSDIVLPTRSSTLVYVIKGSGITSH